MPGYVQKKSSPAPGVSLLDGYTTPDVAAGGVGWQTDNSTPAWVTDRFMRADGKAGWGEDQDGSNFYGAKGRATASAWENNPASTGESGFWGGVSAGNFKANAYHSDDMTELGYGGSIISASAGYREVDADSDHDRGFKVGAGVPAGPLGAFGGRLHHSDVDNDGHTEYGFGVDLPGWMTGFGFGTSFDYTTESPEQDVGAALTGAAIGTMIMPGVGTAIGAGIGLAGSWLYDSMFG